MSQLQLDVVASDAATLATKPANIKHFDTQVTEVVHANFDNFLDRIVKRAAQTAGCSVDREDLAQAAQLALYEAAGQIDDVDPDKRETYVRRQVAAAVKREARSFGVSSLTLEQLIDSNDVRESPRFDESTLTERFSAWDGNIGDEVVDSNEIATHVQTVLRAMPTEMAKAVSLRFGLDGHDELDPADVADIMDLEPGSVQRHLWAAEKMFRHFSAEGHLRRRMPLSSEEFAAFRGGRDFAWYDLREVDLNNAQLELFDLRHAQMAGMNLWGASFFKSNLAGANLWGAQLDGADFQQADLSDTTLERSSFCGANLRLVDATGANLWGAFMVGAKLEHADLRGADLRSTNLAGVNLSRTNLVNADLRGANLRGCNLDGTSLAGANLQGADLSNASLLGTDLRNTDLCWTNLFGADTDGADMTGSVRSPGLKSMYAGKAPRPRRLRPVAESA